MALQIQSRAGAYAPPGSCGDLRERIVRIAGLPRRGALSIIAGEVHGLKLAARAWRFEAVAVLAHLLEAELASIGEAALVDAWLDRMADAIDCTETGPAAMEAMLATIRTRMVA